MITNFKIFENSRNTKNNQYTLFWKVPTGRKFEFALKKIGMDPNNVEFWGGMFKNDRSRDYIFIFKEEHGEWRWGGIDSTRDPSKKYKFMGNIEVEDWEVEAEKYNL